MCSKKNQETSSPYKIECLLLASGKASSFSLHTKKVSYCHLYILRPQAICHLIISRRGAFIARAQYAKSRARD